LRTVFMLLAALLALSACDSPPERRVIAETLLAEMYAEVPHVVDTRLMPRKGARPGSSATPEEFRRAGYLLDGRLGCDAPESVECGAKIEVFENARRAELRSVALEARPVDGERVLRRGAVLLRISGELTRSQAREYEAAFARAVAVFSPGLAEKADLRRE
jgi:hypothetical protein